MRFSACSWIFGPQPIGRVFDHLARSGYDGVELLAEPSQYPVAEIKQLMRETGLRVSSLTGAAGWPRADRDLANPDPASRAAAVAYFKECLHYGAELGAGCIVVCPNAVGKIRPLQNFRDEWNWAVESCQALLETSAQTGVRLALEVLNRYESFMLITAAEGLEFARQVGGDAGVLLDAYHMNIEEPDQPAAIRLAGEKLVHFHVADSNRRAVGDGHIPFPAILAALREVGYAGWVTVECSADGYDPFTPVKAGNWEERVADYTARSVQRLREMTREVVR